MLAQQRRRAAIDRGRGLQVQRAPHHGHAAGGRMRHVEAHGAGLHMGIVEHLAEVVDDAAGDALPLQMLHPPGARAALHQRHHPLDQGGPVADARRVGGEAWVVGQRRLAGQPAPAAELVVVADGDDDGVVLGVEHLIGQQVGMGVAQPPGQLAAGEEVHVHVGHQGDGAVGKRHVDGLARAAGVAVVQRGQDGDGAVEAGGEIGDRHPRLLRPAAGQAVGLAGDRHEAAEALDDEVVAGARRIGAAVPEAGDGAIDQPPVDLLQAGVIEAVSGQRAGPVVLDQHVGPRRQLAGDGRPLGRRQVEGERALAPVGGQVIGGLGGVGPRFVLQEGRPPGAGVVAPARPFHLDHRGAQIGEDLAAPRPGEDAREIEDDDAVERRSHALPPRATGRDTTIRRPAPAPPPCGMRRGA